MRHEIWLESKQHQRTGGRPETEPFVCPRKHEDAQQNSEEHIHESRPVEQPVGIVHFVECDLRVLELAETGKVVGRDFVNDGGITFEVANRQRVPQPEQRRMFGIKPVVTAPAETTTNEMLRFVPRRGFLRVAENAETGKNNCEGEQHTGDSHSLAGHWSLINRDCRRAWRRCLGQ